MKMKSSFNSAMKDPFIKDLVKVVAIAIAFVLAAIGIKMLRQKFKK